MAERILQDLCAADAWRWHRATWIACPPIQEGPARVLTISQNTSPDAIDLHLGMVDDGISVRLRNGSDGLLHRKIGELVEPDQPLEVIVGYDGEVLTVAADGRTTHQIAVHADPSA